MTAYDVFVIVVILFSAAAGGVRGGVREIVSLFSAVLATILALILMPWTSIIGRNLVNPDWAGTILAVVVTFFVIYFGIRLAGAHLSKKTHENPHLSNFDRFMGVLIGTFRALILLGAIHLVVVAAMPGERTPRWLTNASLYSASAVGARAIQIILPGIGKGADYLTPMVDSSVRKGFSEQDSLSPEDSGTTSPANATR